ncbi:hypothetical protein BD626DRAFT_487736 [Schizophyllum amplum]|uniref:Uncharacterized protein n=1 Tax=Schizophyllum amplum TaxID=97359 RepID=A0A550CNV9_9AGAR|nr:hypothetical protein BD626DRAFT_487736 [Auriculariopsis ampla]
MPLIVLLVLVAPSFPILLLGLVAFAFPAPAPASSFLFCLIFRFVSQLRLFRWRFKIGEGRE